MSITPPGGYKEIVFSTKIVYNNSIDNCQAAKMILLIFYREVPYGR
jgi:hypothetical protein